MRERALGIIFIWTLGLVHTNQFQKEYAHFERSEYVEAVVCISDSLLPHYNFEWIYYKAARIDTIAHSSESAPPPNFITALGFTEFEFTQQEITEHHLLSVAPEVVFGTSDNDLTDYLNQQDSLYGRGLVFSLPYKTAENSGVYIDVELVNWDACGTGATFTSKMSHCDMSESR